MINEVGQIKVAGTVIRFEMQSSKFASAIRSSELVLFVEWQISSTFAVFAACFS